MIKPLTVWITTKCGKFLKRWKHQTTLPASWETCMQVKKQQLKTDMEKLTGSKLGKKYIKAVYCHPVYLTYMQNTSREMLGWMNHKLEPRLWGEISITSDMQMIPPYGFFSSHVSMWELDHKEGWVPKNWSFRTIVLEKTWESLGLQGDETSPA